MAFRLETEDGSFVYSGDTGIIQGFENFTCGADFLLHCCYRLSDQTDVPKFFKSVAPTPPEIAALAQRADIKRLVLTHFRVHMGSPGAHETALEEMRTAVHSPAHIAEDLDTFDIPG